MASSSHIRKNDAASVKIEPKEEPWFDQEPVRVSNVKHKRVPSVNRDKGKRVSAVNHKRVPSVNRDMGKRVSAVNHERVPSVNRERGKRACTVNRERGKRACTVNREMPPPVSPQRVRAVNNQSVGGVQWIHAVTRSMQNIKAVQTLHLPSWVVEECLTTRQWIKMHSEVNDRTYHCTINNPGRGPLERYLTNGWYDFLRDHKPKVGESIEFDVKSPKFMVVDILGRKRRFG